MNYIPIVGIEIHVELKTKSKMFCGCTNDPFGAQEPNIYTCPVCLGMPGALPVANKKAIEWAIKIGHALGCEIAHFSKFDRKHYFYPDLPKGYQISQYDQPLCVGGLVKTEHGDVRITRVHLEEDTGKLMHQEVNGEKVSLVDFNRSSVPLVEIVTEPDIKSAEHAKAYTKKIHQLIRYLQVSDADMEKGTMRLEANISVQSQEEREKGELPSYKVEVKNLNSFRYIERAITYEVKRQGEIRENDELPKQETRGWNDSKGQTFAQRSKESAEDYRYFPDPDLPPMRFTDDYIAAIKAQLPTLPDQVIAGWVEKGIKESEARILADEPVNVLIVNELFIQAPKEGLDPLKVITQWVNKKVTFDISKVIPSNVEGSTKDSIFTLSEAEGSSQSNSTTDRDILQAVISDLLTQSKALSNTNTIDEEVLLTTIQQVLEENSKAVADYKAGKQQVIGFLLGMVKKKLGQVDTAQIMKALQKELL